MTDNHTETEGGVVDSEGAPRVLPDRAFHLRASSASSAHTLFQTTATLCKKLRIVYLDDLIAVIWAGAV